MRQLAAAGSPGSCCRCGVVTAPTRPLLRQSRKSARFSSYVSHPSHSSHFNRQPATKSAVERIRGVDADYALRNLVHRRLVVELGRSDAPGRPILYGTGVEFLERFGLASLDDLPAVDAAVAERLTVPEADAADAAADALVPGDAAAESGPSYDAVRPAAWAR